MNQYTYRLFLTKLDKTQICELDIKDFTYTENLSEQDEIAFSLDSLLNGLTRAVDERFDLVRNLYWILVEKYSADTLLSSKYFSITEPTQSYESGKAEMVIKCISIDYQEFNRRKVRGLSAPSATLAQALGYIVTSVLYNTWSIGALPSKAATEYHVVEVDEETITAIFKRLEKDFDVLIFPDTNTNTINVYDRSTYGSAVDLVLSHSNFINSSSFEKKNDQLVTRLYVYGEDGVGISSVNPTGTDYIDDFSYFESYMSPSLLSEYNAYESKVASYAGSFASLLSDLTTYQNELLVIEDDIVNLTTQKYIYDDAMSVYQSQNKKTTTAYSAVYANWEANNLLIAGKESDKTAKEGQITATLASISAIHSELAYTNIANFSSVNLAELSKYIFEDTINLDSITEPSLLLSYGQAYIGVKNEPVYEITLDSVDLFNIAEAQHIRNFINVGDKAWLDLSEIGLDNVSIQMVSYTHNPFENKLSFKFTNTNKIESATHYMNDIFVAANKAATEVKNNAPNWNEYVLDKPSILTDTSEIDAKTNIIRAGLGNTIDHRGFTGTDIGSDPNSHLKLLDDKIVLTRDEWETFHTVFSSEGIYFTNPENTSRIVITPQYGIQIDQNVAETPSTTENWDNRFYADAEGNLFIEGNIFVGDSAENIVIDRFGLNPSYSVWFKNLLPNTDAMVAQTPPIASPTTPFIPWMWTGCMSSADATFRTNRSFKVAPSDTMTNVPAFGGAAVNPSWLPDDMPYLRLSFWSKFGQASVKIKDQTNGNYFSLGKEDIQTIVVGTYTVVFDRQENWYFEPDSLWFDLTESGHNGCEDIRVEITNIHGSESLYISAPALSVDRTGSWPQAYISGPYSIATSEGATIEGSGLDPTGGGGAISGNLFVDTDFPANAPEKSVLVDTDDWSRYDKKDISSATTLTVEDNEHVRCAGSSNYSVTLHTGATTSTVVKYIVNVGTGIVTVVGTISGETNLVLNPGEACMVGTNGTNWDLLGQVKTGMTGYLEDLTDVAITTPTTSQILVYNETTSAWENKTITSEMLDSILSIDNLSNVQSSTPTNGQVLTYNGTLNVWENQSPTGGVSALSDLSDVNLGSLVNGQVLTYNGTTSVWENHDPTVSATPLSVLDSELTIVLGSFFMGTGTIVVSGTTVTGTDTLFLGEAVVGEMIYGMGEDMIPLGIVSTISSDTVLSLYSAAPDYSGAVLIITPGDDSNPQGDPIEGFPALGLATLTKAKEIIDSYDIFTKNAKVTIFVIPRAWSIDFSFMDYNIPISISAAGATTTGSVSFSNCPDVFIDGLSSDQFSFSSANKVYLERTEATAGFYFGYRFSSVLMAEMYNCTLVNNSCPIGISAEKSNIYIEDVSGNATEYGMKSAYGSNIYKISAPYPTGTISNELTETAGGIR